MGFGLQLILIYILGSIIGGLEYMIYMAGKGYYGEDKYQMIRKGVTWSLRLAIGIGLASLFSDPISTNEFCLYAMGYHLLLSLPTQGTYYQLKRWLGGEKLFWFFSHSINGLIWTGNLHFTSEGGKIRYPLLDLYAFMRICLGIMGWLILTVEYY
jgi:hypothetical protein